ncbi:MAG: phage recombination protein Bet [Ferrovibrio sp.]|nr:phage recombination protein Bet [Ferrovibrio sp.]
MAKQKTKEQIAHDQRLEQLQDAASKGQVVQVERGRIPFVKGIEEKFGIGPAEWRALTDSIFPSAKTPEAIVLALAYCRARKLDPFKRPVHIVPVWDSKKGYEVETVWPGIGELRTTAHRTGKFAGCDAASFGPDKSETFTGEKRGDTRTVTVSYPEWCQMTVFRMIDGQRVGFVGPKVYYRASFGTWKGTDCPNDKWTRSPHYMLEKVAEAAALRRAFPEELGNDYTAEEMEGRIIDAPRSSGEETPPPRREDFTREESGGAGETEAEATIPFITEHGEELLYTPGDFYDAMLAAMRQAAAAGQWYVLASIWENNAGQQFADLRKTDDGKAAAEALHKEFIALEAKGKQAAAKGSEGLAAMGEPAASSVKPNEADDSDEPVWPLIIPDGDDVGTYRFSGSGKFYQGFSRALDKLKLAPQAAKALWESNQEQLRRLRHHHPEHGPSMHATLAVHSRRITGWPIDEGDTPSFTDAAPAAGGEAP